MTVNGDCKLLSMGITRSMGFWRGGGSGQEDGKVPHDGHEELYNSFKAPLSAGI